MEAVYPGIRGLTEEQAAESRNKFGWNRLTNKKQYRFIDSVVRLVKEPMILLLIGTAILYFTIGKAGDSFFLLGAVLLVAAISLYQESKSRSAMLKLDKFTQPFAKVIRNGQVLEIASEEVVVGDYFIAEEGASITADGKIVQANDFSVNESILTGESLSVYKNESVIDNKIYSGTTVSSGRAIAVVTEIGNETRFGRIAESLKYIKEQRTPLETEINSFVAIMAWAGAAVFVLVWTIHFLNTHLFLDSLLKAMTLAMSILPEEIPVAFTTFMALGAWRMMQKGILVKKIGTVETLGSATVICIDKTGTLTENEMALAEFYACTTNRIANPDQELTDEEIELIEIAMWASEPEPYDPMDVALHKAYEHIAASDKRPHYRMVHEYPLSGIPPMMTHIFEDNSGRRIIAAKGAPEALMDVSKLSSGEQSQIAKMIARMAEKGYRILGVASAAYAGGEFPETQQEYPFKFKGLVAFYDPPKENIPSVLQQFYKAGISVKIVTGDNAITTHAIARQIGLRGVDASISGEEVTSVREADLQTIASEKSIFSRMFPEAKLKVINALKAHREIVAMTGDGVNDVAALKAAHIGIAMGKRGTETARSAAALVLLEDDLSKMLDAIAIGRRIYSNLKKAIQYIMSIHIPIILTVVLPIILGWKYPNIFSPIHIIFFELIMGPTCSVIYENEPMEQTVMSQPPRPYSRTFFQWKELAISIVQGLAIVAGTFAVYWYAVYRWENEAVTRTMIFLVIVMANIFLTLVNRSFYYSVFTTIRYKNKLVPLIIATTVCICAAILLIRPARDFFQFAPLNMYQLVLPLIAGFLCVIWVELVKWRLRVREQRSQAQ